jgi:hypothetical protein
MQTTIHDLKHKGSTTGNLNETAKPLATLRLQGWEAMEIGEWNNTASHSVDVHDC